MTNGFQALDLRKLPAALRRLRSGLVRSARGRPPASLRGLSPAARALLSRMLADEAHALRAPTLAGTAIGLELGDVIAISRDPPATGGDFVLALNGWALEELRRHPELLGA